jgi:hypothetical protein
LITNGKLAPEEAVRAYHGVLQAAKIKPKLPLEQDLQLTDQSMRYDESAARRSMVSVHANPLAGAKSARTQEKGERLTSPPAAPAAEAVGWPRRADGAPDFEKMTSVQRRAFDQARLQRRFR